MKFERQPQKHEHIGVGGYKRAYKLVNKSGAPEAVLVMKHHHTSEQMKGLFYLNKIATILFPGKIAQVHTAGNFTDENGEIESSQFRAEYYEHDSLHSSMQQQAKIFDGSYGEDGEAQEIFENMSNKRNRLVRRHPGIENFLNEYNAAGFRNEAAAVQISWGPQDVVVDEKGNFTYVDIDVPWDEPEEVGQPVYNNECLRFDPVKLKLAIATLDESERGQAEIYFDRLIALANEVGFQL